MIALCVPFNSVKASATPNLHVPPEEAPHERTFMQWPVSRAVHPDGDFIEYLQDTIATIANTISNFEPVTMLAGKEHHPSARRRLSKRVSLWDIPTDDLWCRDSGPLFAFHGASKNRLAITHIRFNGWGDKQVHGHDGLVAERVARRLGIPLIAAGLVGEAGGVEQDGHGLLMAHTSSWENENRNPGLSRAEIESRLLAAYGAQRMIWSKGVYGEDITDYHIDSLARFTGKNRVLMNLPPRLLEEYPFHRAALATRDQLLARNVMVDVINEPLKRRVPSATFVASYVNFYVGNGFVLAAQFGDTNADERAVAALKRHYPGREVITLDVDALGEIGGGIHCATQQMPKAGY